MVFDIYLGQSYKRQMNFELKIFAPAQCKEMVPEIEKDAWVYEYHCRSEPSWILSIATQGKKHSEEFSLGGFRIVPEARASQLHYSNTAEATSLAHSMGKKVAWSKRFVVAGPLAMPLVQNDKIVGGKCVLLPTNGARMGEPRDKEILDFAIECMQHFEHSTGIFLTTGQDLGHDTMSDGTTYSCKYLNDRFPSSILADTSKPTGEGNYYVLKGMLNAKRVPLDKATIGLIGFGNVGSQVFSRLEESRCRIVVLESSEEKRSQLKSKGIEVYTPNERQAFFSMPMDAIAINGNGSSLDDQAIDWIISNKSLNIITGCENLMMTNASNEQKLIKNNKIYVQPELCGMMGYLTALEERLARLYNKPFELNGLFEAAKTLEGVAEKVTAVMLTHNTNKPFDQVATATYSD